MNPNQNKQEWQRALVVLSAAVVFALAVGTMYWARAIFVPVALGVFFTFVLGPVVHRLEHWGLNRLMAVLATVGLAVAACGLTGWLVGNQLTALVRDLPERAPVIKEKVMAARLAIFGNGDSRFGKMLEELNNVITGPITPKGQPAEPGPDDPAAPRKVVVEPAGPSWSSRLEAAVSPLLEIAGQCAFAFVLCVFMLMKREDLRNRLIRLIGAGQITTTTKAVDDASKRVSRYLLTQLVLNSAFGLIVTAAVFFIGVPYPFVWGFLAALMRYVPYLGTWIGLAPPVLVSIAMSDGWWQPVAIVAVYGGLELLCGNVLEPWLYGSSMGMSEVAQLVAAAFWSFLWGPIGLILSGPLTVCLLVLGKYVPKFEFLEVMLGDEPALSPDVRLYQRLAARDEDEAFAILTEQTGKGEMPEAVADAVLIPALSYMRRDLESGVLDRGDEPAILQTVRELAEDLTEPERREAAEKATAPDAEPVRLLALPARDHTDQIALEIFRDLLGSDRWEVEVAATESLTSELVEQVGRFRPSVICVGALPPGGVSHTRYLCKRLRRQFPGVHIVVGRWGLRDEAGQGVDQLKAAGADHLTTSMAEMKAYLRGWRPVLDTQQKVADGPAAKSNGRLSVGTAGAV